MNTKKLLGILAFSLVTAGCGGGGGGSDTSSAVSTTPTIIDTNAFNNAWDKANVYLPYTSTPIKIKDLGNYPPSPVAISLHGCDGVQKDNLNLKDKYYPIFLAMQGYLVIEPDSYFGMVAGDLNSSICYKGSNGFTVYPNDKTKERAVDAEYAINKVKVSNFWDQKVLLVQGQSEGYSLTQQLKPENTLGVTKWLLTGYPLCGALKYEFTNLSPTLVVNSDTDYSGPECVSKVINKYLNVKVTLIKGDFHVPIFSSEGFQIVKEWVKLN